MRSQWHNAVTGWGHNMNRTPPAMVLRELRREVGFGCPVPDCGNPYLTWHHFDPPWHQDEHHNPAGMIALCIEHHPKADAGAFTKEQLHEFKRSIGPQREQIKGRFDWMRLKLLAVLGGNFYYETPVLISFKGDPVVWFRRDDEGYLLFNIRMFTISKEPRTRIEDNFWISRGNPVDLESPPSGKLLKVRYANGDFLKVEYIELGSVAEASDRYHDSRPENWNLEFPVTAVEVQMIVVGTDIKIGPRETKLPGIIISGAFFKNGGTGIALT